MEIESLLFELDFLVHKQAALRRDLNELQAATKDVPDEVLVKIFSFLRPSGAISRSWGRNSRSTEDRTTADLRRASQVCSVWRSVAVTSPSLWSTLNCNNEPLPWLIELLRRCGTFPIHIVADFYSIPSFHLDRGAVKAMGMIDKFTTILTSSPNIGTVSMVYDGYCPVRPIVERLISDKCTSATSMSFSLYPFPASGGWGSSGILPSLTCTNRLRELEVNGYWPDLTLPCFRQLAWLAVTGVSGITAREWIRVLAGLVELTHLRLENAISSSISQDECVNTINFPMLKTLALIGKFDDGIGEFLLAIDAQRYSLLLHCKLVKNTDLDLATRGLRKWFAVWSANLPPNVSSRRVDVMATHSRFRLHNQIPGNSHSDEWFRIYFNWSQLHSRILLKFQADIFDVFGPILRETRTLSISPDRHECGYICCPDFWRKFHSVETLRFQNPGPNQGIDDSTTGLFVDALCNDVGANLLPMIRKLSFEWEDSMDYPFVFQGSLKRLSRLLNHRIRVVELYARTNTGGISHLFNCKVIATDSKSPRF